MTLNLIRRLVKGEPLTATDHDGNLDKLENGIEARPTTAEQSAAIAAAVAAHVAAADPHEGYLTPAEGDAAYAREDHVHPLPGLVTSTTPGLASATDKQKIDIAVVSDVTGITGADAVTNIVSLTQAEYDAIASPSASTLYVITS